MDYSSDAHCCSGFIRVGCVGLFILAAELPRKIVMMQRISFTTLNESISGTAANLKLNRVRKARDLPIV